MSSPEDFIRDNSEGCDESDFERILKNVKRILAKLKGPLEKFNAEVRLFVAMIDDYRQGEYRDAPRWVICAVAFVLIYILVPFDLVPDPIPLAGLVDDALVVAAALGMLHEELKRYRTWRDKRKEEESED